MLRPGGTWQVQMRSGSDSKRQAIVRALPRPLRNATAAILQTLKILPVQGSVDTWLGCIVGPEPAMTMARDAGFEEIEEVPDDLHAPGTGYWLVGRRLAKAD